MCITNDVHDYILDAGSSKKLTIMERILNICKTYALSKDVCAEATAFLASKFLVRYVIQEYLF